MLSPSSAPKTARPATPPHARATFRRERMRAPRLRITHTGSEEVNSGPDASPPEVMCGPKGICEKLPKFHKASLAKEREGEGRGAWRAQAALQLCSTPEPNAGQLPRKCQATADFVKRRPSDGVAQERRWGPRFTLYRRAWHAARPTVLANILGKRSRIVVIHGSRQDASCCSSHGDYHG